MHVMSCFKITNHIDIEQKQYHKILSNTLLVGAEHQWARGKHKQEKLHTYIILSGVNIRRNYLRLTAKDIAIS